MAESERHAAAATTSRTSRVQSLLHLAAPAAIALSPILVAYMAHAALSPAPPLALLGRDVLLLAAVPVSLTLAVMATGSKARVAAAAVSVVVGMTVLFPLFRPIFIGAGRPGTVRFFALCYFCGCVVLGWLVLRLRPRRSSMLYPMVNISGTVVVLSMLWQVSMHSPHAVTSRTMAPALEELRQLPLPDPSSPRPDVYHIVLDGLGRPDVLQSRYGLNLSELINALKSRGFETDFATGVANYVQTPLSLASMLNGAYVNAFLDPAGESRQPLYELIQRSAVVETLKRFGYQFDFIGSVYLMTAEHQLADHCYCDYPLIGDFESTVLKATFVRAVGLGGIDHRGHRAKIQRSFALLQSLPRASRPRFVLAHIMAPHPPFVFDASGRDVNPSSTFALNDGNAYQGTRREYHERYSAQARYVGSKLLEVVDVLSKRDAVIIIHGDHGPRAGWDVNEAKNTDASESVPVFLAIRWVRGARAGAAPASLVNVYRAFFMRYFQADIAPLPDRSFISSFRKPYEFIEVDPAVMRGPLNH